MTSQSLSGMARQIYNPPSHRKNQSQTLSNACPSLYILVWVSRHSKRARPGAAHIWKKKELVCVCVCAPVPMFTTEQTRRDKEPPDTDQRLRSQPHEYHTHTHTDAIDHVRWRLVPLQCAIPFLGVYFITNWWRRWTRYSLAQLVCAHCL